MGNEGIQGNVTAEVLAVGRNATANKWVTISGENRAEIDDAIARLNKAIGELQITPAAQKSLNSDVAKLQSEAISEKPDPAKVKGLMETIAEKLKLVVEVTKDAVALVEPLGKIAGIFHLSLAAIGLL
jgi:hypothetical protein